MTLKGVCVGIIAKPVGIKGQVKIHPYTSSPSSLLSYKNIFLENKQELVLVNPRINENGDIVTNVKGCPDRNAAELLRLKNIFVAKEDLPKLEEDEYYLDDLAGLIAVDSSNKEIGKVLSALDYGAGAFLDIKLLDTNKIATLPFNKESVLSVNLSDKTIRIDEAFLLQ